MPESYQERIALPSMQPHRAEQVIRMARAKQVKCMRLAEDAITARGSDDINPSRLSRPLVVHPAP